MVAGHVQPEADGGCGDFFAVVPAHTERQGCLSDWGDSLLFCGQGPDRQSGGGSGETEWKCTDNVRKGGLHNGKLSRGIPQFIGKCFKF